MKELLKRLLVAAIAIPLAIIAIYQGGWILAFLVILLTTLALSEFYKISNSKNIRPNHILGYIFSIAIQIVLFLNFYSGGIGNYFLLLSFIIAIFILLVYGVEIWYNQTNSINNTSITISGVFYLSITLSFILAIRELYLFDWTELHKIFSLSFVTNINPIIFRVSNSNQGAGILITSLGSIWVGDSAAYFFGKAFGKHKLLPRVSPKKSWEGAVAGFIASIIAFWLLTYLFIPVFPVLHSIILGAIIGSTGQIGDLAESHLKRDACVKDSSNILPGHGGILDRFDSIIFIMPLIYFYLLFIGY